MDNLSESIHADIGRAIEMEIRDNTLPNYDIVLNTSDVIVIPDGEETQTHTEHLYMEVCRLCLRHDRKLFEISPQNLVAYQSVLGQHAHANPEDKLPLKFCWECNARMTSFTFFRMKAIQTNTILYSLMRPFMTVSELTSTRRQRRAEGVLANPRCIIHRQSRTVPYNIPNDGEDGLPRRSSRLSFCVLQRPRPDLIEWPSNPQNPVLQRPQPDLNERPSDPQNPREPE